MQGKEGKSSAIVCETPNIDEMQGRGVMLQWAGAGILTPQIEIVFVDHLTEAFLPAH